MPKAKVHWAHDLLVAALVGGVSGLVFWLVPPAERAKAAAAAFSVPVELQACTVVIS